MLNITSFYIGDVTKRLKDVKIDIINPIRVTDENFDYVRFELHMSRGDNRSSIFMVMNYNVLVENTKDNVISRLQNRIDTDVVFISKDINWNEEDLKLHIAKELGYKPNTKDYDFIMNRGGKKDYETYKFFTDVLNVEEVLYLKEWEIHDGLKKYWYQ